jgi:hypothetical protein
MNTSALERKQRSAKKWVGAAALLFIVAGALFWPKTNAVVAQGNAAVQMVPGGQKRMGNPGEKGATYYALEAQTSRLTTRFRDGHVAVAERSLTGAVRTALHDRNGNERARLTTNPSDGVHDMLHYEPTGGESFQALKDPNVKPTLDWATRQAYTLATVGTVNLVWDGGALRPKGAARRDVESEIAEVETVWANGLSAKLTRQNYSRREIAKGRVVQGPALVTELSVNGVAAGTGVWFEQDQVFAYALPGLANGLGAIGPEHLKPDFGGWPFKPDATWLNLQTIAMHQFKTSIAKQGFVAKCDTPQPNRLAQLFFPTVYAEAGCDYLHWLDGTIFRACCDQHDKCYEKRGCDLSSWWLVWRSWSCDSCNIQAEHCFETMAGIEAYCILSKRCGG